PSRFSIASGRGDAKNKQLDNLYGVSTFGTRYAVYNYIKGEHHTAPQERWNKDLMEEDGAIHLKRLFKFNKHVTETIVKKTKFELIRSYSNLTEDQAVALIQMYRIGHFKRQEQRQGIKLRREKMIVAKDKESGGFEEFSIVDTISEIPEEPIEPIIVVECKSESVNNASNNPSYGILSTGVSWSFIKYSDNDISEEVTTIFPRMSQQKRD
ncbi:hypothetical protein HDU92_000773, partial [Lobulomyces angularis]